MKWIFIFFFIVIQLDLRAQGIDPYIDSLLRNLETWIQDEISINGFINQDELDNKNEFIRKKMDSIQLVKKSELTRKYEQVNELKFIQKTLMAGTSLMVPEGVTWQVVNLYVSTSNSPYKIKVEKSNLLKFYRSKEIFYAPINLNESYLLDETSDIFIHIDVIESY